MGIWILIHDQNIEQIYKTKFFGVIIDGQLSWKEHIMYISNKVSKAIGVIIKAIPLGKKHSCHYITVWYIIIWPTVVKFEEQHIFITLICYIDLKKSYPYYLFNIFSHSGPLMKELSVLNVKNIYNYLVSQFMYRYENKLLPIAFES